jgi:hypothetical protein
MKAIARGGRGSVTAETAKENLAGGLEALPAGTNDESIADRAMASTLTFARGERGPDARSVSEIVPVISIAFTVRANPVEREGDEPRRGWTYAAARGLHRPRRCARPGSAGPRQRERRRFSQRLPKGLLRPSSFPLPRPDHLDQHGNRRRGQRSTPGTEAMHPAQTRLPAPRSGRAARRPRAALRPVNGADGMRNGRDRPPAGARGHCLPDEGMTSTAAAPRAGRRIVEIREIRRRYFQRSRWRYSQRYRQRKTVEQQPCGGVGAGLPPG